MAVAADAAPAARSGRRLVCRQYPARRAAAGERAARAHRLQDRHVLRLSRCLGGRLRRPHDDRGLGRAARRRAGAGPGRPRIGGADPVRCLCARRACARAVAARRRKERSSRQPASCRRRCSASALGGLAARRSSARASCFRRTARGSNWPAGGQPDPVALKIAGGRAPLTVHGERRAACRRRMAGARCFSSPTGRALCG